MRRTSRRIRPNSRRRTSLRRNSPRFDFQKHFGALREEARRLAFDIRTALREADATGSTEARAHARELLRELGEIREKSRLAHEWADEQYGRLKKLAYSA